MSIKVSDLPTHSKMVENILTVYNSATPEDVMAGMEWYPNAYRICEKLSSEFPFSVAQVAGVMAIMSPGMVWDENKSAPERVIDLYA